MKTIEKYFLVVLILSFQIIIFGQFNTLTPTLPKKTETPTVIEQVKETNNPKTKKEKKSWKDFFNITKKANLNKKLNTLKTILKKNSSVYNKKWDRQKLQDSLILIAKTKMLIRSQTSKNKLTQYEFVNEPREKNYSKIVMPLNREISITSPYGIRTFPFF